MQSSYPEPGSDGPIKPITIHVASIGCLMRMMMRMLYRGVGNKDEKCPSDQEE